MTRGEKGIEHPGVLRRGITRTSGGWSHMYCPPGQMLHERMEEFMVWFRGGLESCEKEEENPIIFAAQTYQRLVSIHPFENGNGRIARLMMDFVLEKHGIPPPIFKGEDILDGVFPLDSRRGDHDGFLEKVMRGVEKSDSYLPG